MPSISPSHPSSSARLRRRILGVDLEDRATDAGVFVLAWGAVRASAVTQLDLAFLEVLLELSPLLLGDLAVVDGRPQGPAVVQELLVVSDDVLVEGRDVSLSGLENEMAEQRSTDADGQSSVDDLGGEEPSEVVRGEGQSGEGFVPLRSPGRSGGAC
jgi:hypothetical protein